MSTKDDPQPDITMYKGGFDPGFYTATQMPNTGGTPVLMIAAGDEPPTAVFTFLGDDETPYSLFGGTGNSYAVPTDRSVELVIPKETPDQAYTISPTPTVQKGTKGTINVITGSV